MPGVNLMFHRDNYRCLLIEYLSGLLILLKFLQLENLVTHWIFIYRA